MEPNIVWVFIAFLLGMVTGHICHRVDLFDAQEERPPKKGGE